VLVALKVTLAPGRFLQLFVSAYRVLLLSREFSEQGLSARYGQ